MSDPYKQSTPQPQPGKGDSGQKPPSPDNAVRQRHQLGEPAKQDSVPGNKAP